LKEEIKHSLLEQGFDVEDCGAHHYNENDDYPDFISCAAERVSADPENSRAIILGGSGQGEAIVANKFPSIRAVVFYGEHEEIVTLSREHNNANILSIGARFVSADVARRVVREWLQKEFSNEERHVRRIEKIKKIEGGFNNNPRSDASL